MDTKSIRGGLIFMMLLILAVNAVEEEKDNCPCKQQSSGDIESNCQNQIKCMDEHASDCNSPGSQFQKGLLVESNCEPLKICGIYLFVRIIDAIGKENPQTKEEAEEILNKKMGCVAEQEKSNEKCEDEESARKCMNKFMNAPKCVDAFIEVCKSGGMEEVKNNFNKAKDNVEAKNAGAMHKYFVGFIVASLFML